MSDIEHLTAHLREAHTEFAKIVASVRPELHRYCSRMTGSALDGEDLVQETLAQGLYRLALTREEVSLRPWLFTIAHHKCVDFLRARGGSQSLDADDRNEPAVEIESDIVDRDLASVAFSHLVVQLPPRERAAFILKEVLGHSLPEIAAILETSVGSVKSALHRGREKLAQSKEAPAAAHAAPSPEIVAYVDAFNRRDWPALQTMLEEEVELELVGFVHQKGHPALEKTYITNYSRLPYSWKLAVGEVDGEPAIVCLREKDGQWIAQHAVRLKWRAGHVVKIRDYVHAPGVLSEALVSVVRIRDYVHAENILEDARVQISVPSSPDDEPERKKP